jgi:hypothetical protein
MCFTTSAQGNRYFQIFGVFSPPRLIENDHDHASLRGLCRRYVTFFAVGTTLFVFAVVFLPAFWAILTAWYYDKARSLSTKTDIPRPPFRFTEKLVQRAQQQSFRAIATSLACSLAVAAAALALFAYDPSNIDVAIVSSTSLALAAILSWANIVKLSAKRRTLATSTH